jgi:hypothetical protein
MKRIAVALAAGALALPAAVLAQVVVVPSSPPAYAVPAPQAGFSYYCANPQGWYPNVQTCSVNWVAYTQPAQTTAYVVTTAPAIVTVPPAPASDSASAVYYVGPHRNAPYQSGIFP